MPVQGERRETAIVVEDDNSLLMVYPELLGVLGVATELINSTNKGIETVIDELRKAITNTAPVLIILDGQYKGGTAVEIIRSLQGDLKGIAVAVFSGDARLVSSVQAQYPDVHAEGKPARNFLVTMDKLLNSRGSTVTL